MSALHLLVENVPDVTSSLAIQEAREKERASAEQLKEHRRRRSLGDEAPSDRVPAGLPGVSGGGRAHSRSSLTLIAENTSSSSPNATPAAEHETSAAAPPPDSLAFEHQAHQAPGHKTSGASESEAPARKLSTGTSRARPEQGLLLALHLL